MALHTAHILIPDWIENALSRKFIDQPKETEKRATVCMRVAETCESNRKKNKKTKMKMKWTATKAKEWNPQYFITFIASSALTKPFRFSFLLPGKYTSKVVGVRSKCEHCSTHLSPCVSEYISDVMVWRSGTCINALWMWFAWITSIVANVENVEELDDRWTDTNIIIISKRFDGHCRDRPTKWSEKD